jgi:hypothetical protein
MSDVMNQCQRFREIRIQAQCRGDRARDLRDFDSVSQAIAEMIGAAIGKNLRLVF